MASSLVNFALSSIRPPHASYYGDIDNTNPVVSAVNREMKEVMAYFHKKTAGTVQSSEACSRGPNWLFDVWNKYEPRLPADFFYNKLIEMGDYLQEVGANDVANHQCYRRYLITRYNYVPANHYDNPQNYNNTFFKNTEKLQDHILTSRALLGFYTSSFNALKQRDPGLLNVESIPECVMILKSLQTFMQCLMVNESFCWMVYNCTILIYVICRTMMTANYSLKAIDYLLWAAVCMESIVPLLGVKYLSWRVTLYSAVCLAYYDCNAGHHAEVFARRGLSKLQELSELERLSDSTYTLDTQCIFRQATAKMASMIFKRTVYETRRRQKGFLRPKVRTNVKDLAQMSWPRSPTEKLLSDMFEGSSAQFLAILEALTSSHRRTFNNAPYSNESELVDVTLELFYAGKEIISGGGGNGNSASTDVDQMILGGVQHDMSLIDLAAAGRDGVTLSSVVRLIKLAFCYDVWSIFDSLLDCTLIYIKKFVETDLNNEKKVSHNGTELCLALMLVMQRVARTQSARKLANGSTLPNGEEPGHETSAVFGGSSTPSVQINDDLVNLSETILYCISEPDVFAPQGLDGDVLIDKDMIMDAALLLWKKCKQALGKIPVTSKRDFGSNLLKTGEPEKWLHILTVVHSALLWCDVGLVDPTIMSEVCLRLAVSLEAAASSNYFGSRSSDVQSATTAAFFSTSHLSPNAQLAKALTVLKSGFETISAGRSNDSINDAKHVADILWMNKADQLADCKLSKSNAFIRDLVIEMLVVYYRISFRLVDKKAEQKSTGARSHRSTPRITPSKTALSSGEKLLVLTEQQIKETVGGSYLCRAIYLMEKADQPGIVNSEVKRLLELSKKAIENAQEEERRLFEESWLKLNNPYQTEDLSDLPPPPILLSRSDTSMTFKPTLYNPEKSQVAWYRIFGRLSSGPNIKVRLNDYYLPGTGEEVPAGDNCLLRVSGLKRNHRYVFAVAAYTSDGKIVGGSVGKTSNPIVASHPLSCLAVWGHLAHVSYKLGCLHISKQACSVLWDIFVTTESSPPSDTWSTSIRHDYALTFYHLNREVAMESSPVLLHHALTGVFVAVETAIREKELFCDKLCEEGPLLESQLSRMRECERMLVAIEMAGWLNDSPLVLQTVVQTYGLVVPIIQAKVITQPVMQVALRCICSLLEVKGLLRQKRSNNSADSLFHMVAALTNYLAKCAKVKGNNYAALAAIENGKSLFRAEPGPALGKKNSLEQVLGKRRSKKSFALEPLSEKSLLSLAELGALEDRVAFSNKETRVPEEMLGTEDSNTVLTKLSKMRSFAAFREVAKFKRRSRFLEFFVLVLRKALKTMNLEMAVECSQDIMTTLHRRNEVLAVNQAVVSKQAGGVAVQGEEARKYAAAVAEFSMDSKKTKKDTSVRSKKENRKVLSPRSKRKGSAGAGQEDPEKKQAMITLANCLGKYFRNYMKRKKFRKVLSDEYRHKTEFNMLNGLLHLQLFIDKIKERQIARGYRMSTYGCFDFLDQEWWSLDTSGALVVGWDDGSRISGDVMQLFKEDDRKVSERALERAAYHAISSTLVTEPVPLPQSLEDGKRAESPIMKPTRSIPSTASPVLDDALINMETDSYLPLLKVSLLCFQRGMVLAHRGKCWTLLQNTASSFYSAAMTAYQVACDGSEPLFPLKKCRELLRLPMYLAADLLMDMLMSMDDVSEDGSWLYQSVVGEPKATKGGLSLKFDKNLDDCGIVNILLIKKIVMQAIQILHHSTRYEALIDICLKFSEITHGCFFDVIQPLIIHAQAKLHERVQEFSGSPHPQPHLLDAAKKLRKSNINNRDYLRLHIEVKPNHIKPTIDVGGFIDPQSHDVYEGGKRAMALSSVPFDPKHSMKQLSEAFYGSQYITRALKHSRKLLLVYLASQHNSASWIKKNTSKKTLDSTSASCVEFSLKVDQPHSPAPPDLTKIDFTSTNSVEVLASAQPSNVVQSYQRTIELLESHGEHDLVSQASNELGNLFLHLSNNKAALKWWKHALDQVLRTNDSVNQWRKLVKNEDSTAEELLSICGLWGCLHAITVACKIGEFTAPDSAVKLECALLSSHLVRSIFRSSMPHPSSDCDYATYEILPSRFQISLLSQSKTKLTSTPSNIYASSILSGVEFFSEAFRCDILTLIASLHWLCDYLIQMKYLLQALPAIALYQYLATFICKDTQRSAYCRCLKVNLLTELRMFREATTEMMNLLCGGKLPHSTDLGFAPFEAFPISNPFDVTKPIDDPDNLRVLETVASKRLSNQLHQLYGPHLTCEISLCQANLLVQLASCISCLPQKPTMQDLQFVSPEVQVIQNPKSTTTPSSRPKRKFSIPDDAKSTVSAFSTASTSKNVYKLFTKRERPMGMQLLKGMLLAVADNLVTTIIKALEGDVQSLVASEVWFYVKSLLLISDIQQQRQLSTLSAAKAVHAMNILQKSSVFIEDFQEKTKKPRSAMRGGRIENLEELQPEKSSEESLDFYPVFEQIYRSRLNSRLWLDCRYRLCQALTSQIKGLGKIEDNSPKNTGLLDHSQVQLFCAEGLAEAEASNDVEMQALFLIQGASLDGITSNESKHMLDDATSSLDEQAELSSRAVFALVEGTIYLADISLASGFITALESLQSYRSAHSVLLLKVIQEGNTIQHYQASSDLSSLQEPIINCYSYNLELLAKIKLRLARALVQNLKEDETPQEFSNVAQILSQAELLCSTYAFSQPFLLAEINLELGKIQKCLLSFNQLSIKIPVAALQKSLNLAEESNDLSLVRQAHVELALLYLENIKLQGRLLNAQPSIERAITSIPSVKDERSSMSIASSRSLSLDYGVFSQPLEVTNIQDSIASSLHAAYFAACAMRQRSILPGEPKVTSLPLNTDDRVVMPEFLVVDLATDHTAFPQEVVSGDDMHSHPVVTSLKMSSSSISWIHIFMYNVLLQRKSRIATSYARENDLDMIAQNSSEASESSPELEGHSTYVRAPLKSNHIHIRLSALHQYLSRHPSYAATTQVPFIPQDTSFVTGQWHWSDDRSSCRLLWCLMKKDGSAESNYIAVNPKMHESVAQQAISLKKQTEEYFGRQDSIETASRQKSRARSLQIDSQLEEDWKHVLSQIANLLSTQDEPITDLPFVVSIQAAGTVVDLFSVGFFLEASHPLFKWISGLLSSS